MKYIPSLKTNKEIQNKLDYLKTNQDFNPININWMLVNIEKLALLITSTTCSSCNNQVGENWCSVEGRVLCDSCFKFSVRK